MEGDFLTVLFQDSEEKVPGVAVPLGTLLPLGLLQDSSVTIPEHLLSVCPTDEVRASSFHGVLLKNPQTKDAGTVLSGQEKGNITLCPLSLRPQPDLVYMFKTNELCPLSGKDFPRLYFLGITGEGI